MMKKILAAVDGSEPSHRALQHAAQLATAFGGSLTIAYVVPPIAYPSEVVAFTEEYDRGMREYGRSLVEKEVAAVKSPKLAPEGRVLSGSPAETLAALADSEGYELLVVGSRGMNAVKRVLLGSTSDRLVHICSRPVLIVR